MMLIQKFGTVALVVLLSYGFSTVDSLGNEAQPTDLLKSSTLASQASSVGIAIPNESSSTSNGPPKPPTPSSITLPAAQPSPSVPSTSTQSAKPPIPSSATLPAAQPSPSVPRTSTQSAKPPIPSSATLPAAQPSPSPSVPSTSTQSAKPPIPSSTTLPAAQLSPSPSVPRTSTQSAKPPIPSSTTLPAAQPSPSVRSTSVELSKPSTQSSTSVSSTSVGPTTVVSDDAKEKMGNATGDHLHPSKTHDDGNGATGPMDFLTYFIIVVITLVICYLLYSNRQRLKIWYNNRQFLCVKGSKGSYKRLPVIVNENELDQFKSYVY